MYVQGTTSDLNEPAGHVQTEPHSVINLVSGGSEEERQPVTRRNYGEHWVDVDETFQKIEEDIRLGKQPTNVPYPMSAAAESSIPQMTSAGASPSTGPHLSHEANTQAESSSRRAMQIGDFPPDTTFHPRNVGRDDVNRPPPIQPTPQEKEQPRVTVNLPPQLPSGTRRPLRTLFRHIWSV